MRNAAALALIVAILSLVSACKQRGSGTEVGAGVESGIERKFERGPITVVIRVSPEEPTIADTIELSLEITADEDYSVELPSFGEKLDQFGITDYSETPPKLVEGKRNRSTRTYKLEPFLSGDYVIPPMKFTFGKRESEDEEEGHELETDEIALKVTSLLDETKASLKIHEITGPVSLEPPGRAWLWWTTGGVAVGVAVLAGLIVWLIRRRGKRVYVTPPVPAHEIAFRDLERLIAEDLPRKGEIKPFYQRISNILRHYIENRFGLHAPDQTTEEFFYVMRESPALPPVHQGKLKEFLIHCDLVKFAEHVPSTEDIQRTFDSCKNFIVETQAESVTVSQQAESAQPVPTP